MVAGARADRPSLTAAGCINLARRPEYPSCASRPPTAADTVTEILPTIAEIAIVITGFAGLVVSLNPHYLRPSTLGYVRVQILVSQTIMLLLLCFTPALMQRIDIEAQWFYANGAMATAVLGTLTWRVWTQVRTPGLNQSSSAILSVVTCVLLTQVAACIAFVFGWFADAGELIYHCGILLILTVSCLNFVLLLFSARRREAPTSSPDR